MYTAQVSFSSIFLFVPPLIHVFFYLGI
jgi:hypothetical protein